MTSQILHGHTSHCRFRPTRHAFDYRMLWLVLDLDELPALDRAVAWFGHNRRAPVSISDADYGGPGAGDIRGKVLALLERDGVTGPLGRISLITLPRVCGYVFNPVSFFRCYRPDGQLAAMLAEVSNTFGEKHHYVLQPVNPDAELAEAIRFRFPKAFYVSPFFRVQGEYELLLTEDADDVSLQINLRQDGQLVLSAEMAARGTPLTSRSLAASAIRLPLIVASVMWRIHWQAFQLCLRRHVPAFIKPEPASAATIRARGSSVWQRLRAYLVRLAAERTQNHRLAAPGHSTLEDRT